MWCVCLLEELEAACHCLFSLGTSAVERQATRGRETEFFWAADREYWAGERPSFIFQEQVP